MSQTENAIAREIRRANQKYVQKAIARVAKELKSNLLDPEVTSSMRFYIGTRISMVAENILK